MKKAIDLREAGQGNCEESHSSDHKRLLRAMHYLEQSCTHYFVIFQPVGVVHRIRDLQALEEY